MGNANKTTMRVSNKNFVLRNLRIKVPPKEFNTSAFKNNDVPDKTFNVILAQHNNNSFFKC